MDQWESSDIRSKLGMLLSADMSDPLQVRALDIMLMKGRGFQREDIEKYPTLSGFPDFEYRAQIGRLRDEYLPKELPENPLCDIGILAGIFTLSPPQQYRCAENLVSHLEWAEGMVKNMYPDGNMPEKIRENFEAAAQVMIACRQIMEDYKGSAE